MRKSRMEFDYSAVPLYIAGGLMAGLFLFLVAVAASSPRLPPGGYTVQRSTPNLDWICSQIHVDPRIGFGSAAMLIATAIWSIWSGWRKTRSKMDGVDTLRTRVRMFFPAATTLEELPLPDLDEWLTVNVGLAALGSDAAIGHALAKQLTAKSDTVKPEKTLRVHITVLFAMFALRATKQSGKDYMHFRDEVAISMKRTMDALSHTGHPTPSERTRAAEQLSADIAMFSEKSAAILAEGTQARTWFDAIIGRHGWTETALMGALAAARKKGTLPETDFSWLMDIDRPLALALNAVGRPSFLPESLGAACQWQAELRAGMAVTEPVMYPGVMAIRRELASRGPSVPKPDYEF